MFQGSKQVEGSGRFELVQGAGRLPQRHHQLRAHQLLRAPCPPTSWSSRCGWRRTGWSSLTGRPRRRVHGEPAGRRQERAPPAVRQRALRHRLRAAHRARVPGRAPPHHHTPIGSMADSDAATPGRRPELLPAPTTRRTTRSCPWWATSTGADARVDREVLPAPSPGTTGSPSPATARSPTPSASSSATSSRRTSPPAPLMAAYRLPQDGTRACDAADVALTILGGGSPPASTTGSSAGTARPSRPASASCGSPARRRSAGWT